MKFLLKYIAIGILLILLIICVIGILSAFGVITVNAHAAFMQLII